MTNFDKGCLVLALISIVPWLLTNNVLWSVILASFTDMVGFFPTMRKTWKAPYSESLGSMLFDSVKHSLSIASLGTYSLVNWLYPAAVLVTKAVIVSEIAIKRNMKKTDVV